MKKYWCRCKDGFINRKCKMDEEKTTVFCNKEHRLIDLKNKKDITILDMEE